MANKYWVGGGASTNWNATGNTNWSDTDGGANNATAPAAGDDVFFKSSAACTLNVSTTVGSIDCTGYTGTWAHNTSITITMDGAGTNDVFKLVAGMTYVPGSTTRAFAFTHTSGTMSVTTAGKSLGTLTQNGAGGTIALQDALTMLAGGIITVTAGTFNGNNQNVTAGAYSSSGSAVRELQIGSGAWVINSVAGIIFDVSGTSMTLAAYTGSITITAAPASARTFNLGTSKLFHSIVAENTAASPQFLEFTGTTPSITTLTLTGPVAVRLIATTTYTITNISLTGAAYNDTVTLLAGSGITPTIALGNASPSNQWCVLGGLTLSTSTLTATNSVDAGGNSGTISISGPSGGGVVGVIGS